MSDDAENLLPSPGIAGPPIGLNYFANNWEGWASAKVYAMSKYDVRALLDTHMLAVQVVFVLTLAVLALDLLMACVLLRILRKPGSDVEMAPLRQFDDAAA